VVKQPFYGGFGLIAVGGIPKPSYNTFKLLHQLGGERIALHSDSALVTHREDGSLVVAVWNLVPPDQSGAPKTITLQIKHAPEGQRAYISRVDREHGDVRPAYDKMGSPRYPTQAQLRDLRKSAELPAPEIREVKNGELTLTIPAQGLAVVELK
jgi:xylan 1,4-beta-xylosidase